MGEWTQERHSQALHAKHAWVHLPGALREIERLKECLEQAVSTNHLKRAEAAERAVDRYGDHDSDCHKGRCSITGTSAASEVCTCGFDNALEGKN